MVRREFCNMYWRICKNAGTGKRIWSKFHYYTCCNRRFVGTVICDACLISNNYENISIALGTRSLLWLVPGRRKTKRYFDEYSIFIGHYCIDPVDYAMGPEKKKSNLNFIQWKQ